MSGRARTSAERRRSEAVVARANVSRRSRAKAELGSSQQATPTVHEAPGAYRPSRDTWGRFDVLSERLAPGAIAIVDRRVAHAHPHVMQALQRAKPALVVTLAGGERIKTLATAERVLARAVSVRRGATVIAIGGGTIGDLATVVAHLHKRGANLIQVPTTVLAAVDSSVGGKGAVDVAGTKNAAGVFHYASEGWLCPELFSSLADAQLREGAIEAWKMAVTLSEAHWRAWLQQPPPFEELIRASRTLKEEVCARDPYELEGLRRVLNFGHTFGHAFEALSRFRVRHGDAVGLGMLCALDIGRVLGVTPEVVAEEVQSALTRCGPVRLARPALARLLKNASQESLARTLMTDKKRLHDESLTMVLLERVGVTRVAEVPHAAWTPLVAAWRRGERP